MNDPHFFQKCLCQHRRHWCSGTCALRQHSAHTTQDSSAARQGSAELWGYAREKHGSWMVLGGWRAPGLLEGTDRAFAPSGVVVCWSFGAGAAWGHDDIKPAQSRETRQSALSTHARAAHTCAHTAHWESICARSQPTHSALLRNPAARHPLPVGLPPAGMLVSQAMSEPPSAAAATGLLAAAK